LEVQVSLRVETGIASGKGVGFRDQAAVEGVHTPLPSTPVIPPFLAKSPVLKGAHTIGRRCAAEPAGTAGRNPLISLDKYVRRSRLGRYFRP
jgi:hypothetical protein